PRLGSRAARTAIRAGPLPRAGRPRHPLHAAAPCASFLQRALARRIPRRSRRRRLRRSGGQERDAHAERLRDADHDVSPSDRRPSRAVNQLQLTSVETWREAVRALRQRAASIARLSPEKPSRTTPRSGAWARGASNGKAQPVLVFVVFFRLALLSLAPTGSA